CEDRYCKIGGPSKKAKYKSGRKDKVNKCDDDDLDEKLKREREDRIRHFQDIDQYVLPVEVVID
ncbi:7503_t:CDS:2, partial [Racocetra fulgida]